MSKRIILSLVIFLATVFSGICYAAENPFNGLTQDQVIHKYLEGRQLDPVEGVWLDPEIKPIIIIKSSLIDSYRNPDNYDYLMIEYSSKQNVEIVGVRKTQYQSCFQRGKMGNYLRFLSPNTLHYAVSGIYGIPIVYVYTRIFPSELK